MARITNFKATNPTIWALVALSVAGGFFYANHSTIAARFGAKPAVVETAASGLVPTPSVVGIVRPDALQW